MCNPNHKQPKNMREAHDQEHRQWSRRSFIQALGIGGSGSLLLGGTMLRASSVSPLAVALNKADSDRVLVLIRLQGGNDGLNTIVPMVQYDDYANYRPNIYHKENKLIALNGDFSIPQHMAPLESMWGDGKMKVVHGVGYQDQSLSHFTSSDIWASAEKTERYEEGFLGRHFTEKYPDYLINRPVEPLAIQIGSIGNLIFEDEDISYSFLVSNPDQLQQIAENGVQFDMANIDKTCHSGIQKEFLRQKSNATYAYSGVIHEAYMNASNAVAYDDDKISQQLAIVARLIKGNLGTKVFMVTLNGFDTHVGQIARHDRLMTELSGAVKNFFDDLNQTGHDENVLGMTFSEFGRRAMENGSSGTDHGAASTTLFFGPGLQGNGFVGEYPDITDLDAHGNLKFNTDFRGLYATVLSQWLCLDVGQVQNALVGDYQNLDLGFGCTIDPGDPNDPTDPNDPKDPDNPNDPNNPDDSIDPNDDSINPNDWLSHTPIYDVEDRPSIVLNVKRAMHVDIQLYNFIGQRLGNLKNGFVAEGSYIVNIDEVLENETLTPGKYIYRITTFNGASSKMILIR